MVKRVRKTSKDLNFIKFYQELLKENSNPRLKGNRKGIIVKGKEFYIHILNTFPLLGGYTNKRKAENMEKLKSQR